MEEVPKISCILTISTIINLTWLVFLTKRKSFWYQILLFEIYCILNALQNCLMFFGLVTVVFTQKLPILQHLANKKKLPTVDLLSTVLRYCFLRSYEFKRIWLVSSLHFTFFALLQFLILIICNVTTNITSLICFPLLMTYKNKNWLNFFLF